MPVYRISPDKIEALPKTSFPQRGIRERAHLQRLIRANIGVVTNPEAPEQPGVLVIAEEFSEWDDSRRRIDLLGVDDKANLVVIELKRDDDGGHMELQAIRYAAMVSGMTFARAIEVFQGYLDRDKAGQDARGKLLEFLGWDEPREDDFARDVRILLVAGDFGKEVTTAVLWLNERKLDIRCVRLKPYANGEQTIVDAQQVVPLPEAEQYMVQIKQKGQAIRAEESDRHGLRLAFWGEFLPLAGKATPRFAGRTPGEAHFVSAPSGIKGLRYVYCIWQSQSGVEFYIDRDDGSGAFNKALFDSLYAKRVDIEKAYGGSIGWERLDDKRACRLYDDSVPVGLRSPREQWPKARDGMIDAMTRLERALKPYLEAALAAASSKE